MTAETIFALSSGAPPAALAIIRISGPKAGDILKSLSGTLPEPRRVSLKTLRATETGEELDRALLLWLPGPASATGEDQAELHLHGGRAVVAAVEAELDAMPDVRRAEPGEFTRRAFENGKLDLAEAEGLADLLFAETEAQRRAAFQMAGGSLSRVVDNWLEELLRLAALTEAELDFSDEDDVGEGKGAQIAKGCVALADKMAEVLAQPRAERLRDGIKVVLAGPPNAGKSTLINTLVDREAAIVTAQPGTTRDLIEAPVAISGVPFLFVDTAGLRSGSEDLIENIGIDRAEQAMLGADILLWLGPEGEGPDHARRIEIAARADADDFVAKSDAALTLSAQSGQGMGVLVERLLDEARSLLPAPDAVTVNRRQAAELEVACEAVRLAAAQSDFLLMAEQLRLARRALDAITGRAGTEDMLDALFERFCIGK